MEKTTQNFFFMQINSFKLNYARFLKHKLNFQCGVRSSMRKSEWVLCNDASGLLFNIDFHFSPAKFFIVNVKWLCFGSAIEKTFFFCCAHSGKIQFAGNSNCQKIFLLTYKCCHFMHCLCAKSQQILLEKIQFPVFTLSKWYWE